MTFWFCPQCDQWETKNRCRNCNHILTNKEEGIPMSIEARPYNLMEKIQFTFSLLAILSIAIVLGWFGSRYFNSWETWATKQEETLTRYEDALDEVQEFVSDTGITLLNYDIRVGQIETYLNNLIEGAQERAGTNPESEGGN